MRTIILIVDKSGQSLCGPHLYNHLLGSRNVHCPLPQYWRVNWWFWCKWRLVLALTGVLYFIKRHYWSGNLTFHSARCHCVTLDWYCCINVTGSSPQVSPFHISEMSFYNVCLGYPKTDKYPNVQYVHLLVLDSWRLGTYIHKWKGKC